MILQGKRVLIAGASGGIGLAVAQACSENGAEIFAGYAREREATEKLCAEIMRGGGRATALHLDVTVSTSVDAAVETITRDSGKLDALVNCSGIHVAGPLISLSEEQIESQLKINLEGAIRLSRAVTAPMVRQRSGSILNLGSVSAHRVTRGHAVYSATKAGLEGFTRALAAELAKRGIRVNCLLPGPVLTKMLTKSVEETGDDPSARVPLGRTIEPREIADAACFLISDKASAITGIALPVDGGYCLW